MDEKQGLPGRPKFVPAENLQSGGGTRTSGEVVLLGLLRRFVAPAHLQSGGGLCVRCKETGELCPACETKARTASKPIFVDQKFLNAPIIGNPEGFSPIEAMQIPTLGQPLPLLTTLQGGVLEPSIQALSPAAVTRIALMPGGIPRPPIPPPIPPWLGEYLELRKLIEEDRVWDSDEFKDRQALTERVIKALRRFDPDHPGFTEALREFLDNFAKGKSPGEEAQRASDILNKEIPLVQARSTLLKQIDYVQSLTEASGIPMQLPKDDPSMTPIVQAAKEAKEILQKAKVQPNKELQLLDAVLGEPNAPVNLRNLLNYLKLLKSK